MLKSYSTFCDVAAVLGSVDTEDCKYIGKIINFTSSCMCHACSVVNIQLLLNTDTIQNLHIKERVVL